jgi:hypothetical protein
MMRKASPQAGDAVDVAFEVSTAGRQRRSRETQQN